MIQVTNLTKRYGPRTAIDDLNFEISKGEIVGFLGPNGAGKSTTMKILTGMTSASEGSAQVAGFDVFDSPIEVKRNIGYLPENPPVYTEMTVEDYLRFAARLHGVPKNQIKTCVSSAIEKTNIGDVRKRLIGNLSKGYRQRVGIAQAIAHNPKVLILDEPTVGLDPKQIIEIRKLIKSLGGDHTIILSTHILPEVTATCERVIVINKGKIAAQDSLSQLTARVQHVNTYKLITRVISPEALAALKAIPGVKSISESLSKTENELSIEVLPNAGDVRERITEAVMARKLGLLEFTSQKISLEEIFLQLTTEEKL
ncbi:MAG: ATP-binding cassette domain-containing protein [Bdellovibrionales bacterium]|nr:ATP-binding cassette domain-containing protein [Bdellovibrionales bacterium]